MRNQPGQNKWVAYPLPKGPYVLVRQDEESNFKKNYATMQLEYQKNFEVKWGYVTFAVNPETFEPIKVGSDYDSSD